MSGEKLDGYLKWVILPVTLFCYPVAFIACVILRGEDPGAFSQLYWKSAGWEAQR